MCVGVLLLVLFGVGVVCGGCWLWLVVVLTLVSLCFRLLRGCWGFFLVCFGCLLWCWVWCMLVCCLGGCCLVGFVVCLIFVC